MDENSLEPWNWTLEDILSDMKADIHLEHSHPEAPMDLRLMKVEFTFVDQDSGEQFTDAVTHEEFVENSNAEDTAGTRSDSPAPADSKGESSE